jgi:hypothetical protein
MLVWTETFRLHSVFCIPYVHSVFRTCSCFVGGRVCGAVGVTQYCAICCFKCFLACPCERFEFIAWVRRFRPVFNML